MVPAEVAKQGPRMKGWMKKEGWVGTSQAVPGMTTSNRKVSIEAYSLSGGGRTILCEDGTDLVHTIKPVQGAGMKYNPPSILVVTVPLQP